MRVYQGQFLVAELMNGRLQRHEGIELPLDLHALTNRGLVKVVSEIDPPKLETDRDYDGFLFIAFWNVFAALANCISDDEHGGAIVVFPNSPSTMSNDLRIKYPQQSPNLRIAFVNFINARNAVIDHVERSQREDTSLSKGDWAEAELKLADCQTKLVEAIRFVSRLSGCDGAIVLSDDLNMLGFGAEIKSEMNMKMEVREIVDEMRRIYKQLDVEQFGLRHRSAIKLVSQNPNSTVIVVSQDGPISVIWSDDASHVSVKRGANLTNMNMPWA